MDGSTGRMTGINGGESVSLGIIWMLSLHGRDSLIFAACWGNSC